MFIQLLEKYLNGACFSKTDLLLGLISKRWPYRRNAGKILASVPPPAQGVTGNGRQHISVEPYRGRNRYVTMMREYLEQELDGQLFEAVVHGSLATGEEIGYSDFDALVVLKDAVFEDKERLAEVAYKLGEARKIMLTMDPLQHHGWFVLTESMLKDFPVLYFPPVLFEYSRSILHDEVFEFDIGARQPEDFKKPFDRLVQSLLLKLQRKDLVLNAYALKNLLSEFMLLPAFYVQARDGKGIFKGQSFEAVRTDLKEEEWEGMSRISGIRAGWKYEVKGVAKHFYTNTNPFVRTLMKKYAFKLAPGTGLSGDDQRSMRSFVKLLAQRMHPRTSDSHPVQ